MSEKNSHDIEIIEANENNLKNLSVSIPKNKLVTIVGVSGSGKSSLIFETLARESNRQWQDSYPLYIRNKLPHYDRPDVTEIRHLPPSIIIDQKAVGANSRSTVGTIMDLAPLVRLLFSRVGQPSAGGSMAYSPNHPAGMCPRCTGIGTIYELTDKLLFDLDKTIQDGGIRFSQFAKGWQHAIYTNHPDLDQTKKLRDFSENEWNILKYGGEESVTIQFLSNANGNLDSVAYEGIVPRFTRLYLKRDISKLKQKLQEEVLSFVHKEACPDCQGTGLNPLALSSKINGHNIVDYQRPPVADILPLLQDISDPVGRSIAKQMAASIERMVTVGIGYLSLNRQTETLSGGELQRIKLVRHLGSNLSNINYIFDEPTAGLHHHDAEKIGHLLLELRDQQNNVLVVEHHRQMISLADQIIEIGPLSGQHGGQLVFQGSLEDLKTGSSFTAQSMTRRLSINEKPRPWTQGFPLENVHRHNLKNLNLTIPKGILTAVTGVAGSGKSTLITQEFSRKYKDAIVVNQKPIGTSVRSTPATYTGVMDEIRKVFAKANGVAASWFSFNSKGACPICKGSGKIVYDMAFADKVEVVCEECSGKRYNPTALSYTYQGMNITDVLALTIEEALKFFDSPKILKPLQTLEDVGLGYMTLGQPTSTLSGGEIQRVKLANQLQKQGEIFILDEPSTGLHDRDVETLLALIQRLINQENTVIMIEHRLEMIGQADWIIDLGPEGGSKGGEIIFEGTPRQILNCSQSKTGQYLKQFS